MGCKTIFLCRSCGRKASGKSADLWRAEASNDQAKVVMPNADGKGWSSGGRRKCGPVLVISQVTKPARRGDRDIWTEGHQRDRRSVLSLIWSHSWAGMTSGSPHCNDTIFWERMRKSYWKNRWLGGSESDEEICWQWNPGFCQNMIWWEIIRRQISYNARLGRPSGWEQTGGF